MSIMIMYSKVQAHKTKHHQLPLRQTQHTRNIAWIWTETSSGRCGGRWWGWWI